MFSLGSQHDYYFYLPACDLRKGFDGLSGLVRKELGQEPLDGSVYVFLNRRRTHMKLLHWEAGGFVLYYKRLESGRFHLPKHRDSQGRLVWSDLVLMIEGIEVESYHQRRRYHLAQKMSS